MPYEKTMDGSEPHFECNHLPIFPSLPLYFLASSPPPPSSHFHVINMASMGHRHTGIRFGDVGFDDEKAMVSNSTWCWFGIYALRLRLFPVEDKIAAYAQSKTANILSSNEIARQAKESNLNVLAFFVHPGSMYLYCLDVVNRILTILGRNLFW